MQSTSPRQFHAATHRAVARVDALDWPHTPWRPHPMTLRPAFESLLSVPWLRGAPSRHAEAETPDAAPDWDDTPVSDLDPLQDSGPFRETLSKLEMREPTALRLFLESDTQG